MDARRAAPREPDLASGSAPCSPPSMTLHAACGGGLRPSSDRGCARRRLRLRSGQRNGLQPNKETHGRLDTPAAIREHAITGAIAGRRAPDSPASFRNGSEFYIRDAMRPCCTPNS
jgi:hypothetical protein